MTRSLPLTARILALVICVAALLALGAQFNVSRCLMGQASATDTLWRMAGYFTILTNLGLAAIMAATAAGFPCSARLWGGMTLAIVIVGIVYHLILSRLWAPVGLAWWADQGLHTAVPVLTAVWWLAFAPKSVSRRDLLYWLIWPAVYAVYALIRGGLTGFWPYPFLDAAALGWPRVALNVVLLVAVFAGAGAALVALARRLSG